MEVVIELADEIFHIAVRLGSPQYVTGLVDVVRNPIYATGVGVLLFGNQHRSARGSESAAGGSAKGVWERMKKWFKGNF